MMGDGQLIGELKLGEINHISKNCVCVFWNVSQGDLPTSGRDRSLF
jgi:hypothetical protein